MKVKLSVVWYPVIIVSAHTSCSLQDNKKKRTIIMRQKMVFGSFQPQQNENSFLMSSVLWKY